MNHHNLFYPDFGHSIVNLAATMQTFLGNQPKHPVLPQLTQKLSPQFKNVVYVVVDGMGDAILQKNLRADGFFRSHQIDTLTSVFPSTTAAATTSLLSGLTPAEHGWLAWSVDFDGDVIELFPNRNFYTRELTPDRDFARKHLPYRYIWEGQTTGRAIYTCYPAAVSAKIPAATMLEFDTLRQMFRRLDQVLATPEPKFIYNYYAELDTTMHHYGTKAGRSRRLLKKIQKGFCRLHRRHPDTLFVITADHGQIDVQGFTRICDDPAIQDCLAHPISLDPRGCSFKIKPGMDAAFQQAFQKYTDAYVLFASADLAAQGVFGDFSLHPDYQKHLGDYLAVGTERAQMMVFKDGKEYHHHRLYHGCHTGMTADEMRVPLIVVGDQPARG